MAGVSIVGGRLQEARLRAGLSQRQLCIKAGFDKSGASPRVTQYEAGKHMPNLRDLTRLADVLKVPPPYFYCQDSKLANLILKFGTLDEAQKKKLLDFVDTL